MGCYDGAEVCELVGIYIFNNLSNTIDKDGIGLYLGIIWKFILTTNRAEKEKYH